MCLVMGPGLFVRNDGTTVDIQGRTRCGRYWWSLAADWYTDKGEFLGYAPNKFGDWVHTPQSEDPGFRKNIQSREG